MDSGESSTQNKRKERVKSIFDSDDSDEDDKGFSHSHSNDDDDDEDDDLRKRIDEVCFNLSNEEHKLEFGSLTDKGNEINIPMPTFTVDVGRSKLDFNPKIMSNDKKSPTTSFEEKLEQNDQDIFENKVIETDNELSSSILEKCENFEKDSENTESDANNQMINNWKYEDSSHKQEENEENVFSTSDSVVIENVKSDFNNKSDNDLEENVTMTSIIKKETPFDDSDSITKEVVHIHTSDLTADTKDVSLNVSSFQEVHENFDANKAVEAKTDFKETTKSEPVEVLKNDIEKETESYLSFSEENTIIEDSDVQPGKPLVSEGDELTISSERICADSGDSNTMDVQSNDILLDRCEENNAVLPSSNGNKSLSFYLEDLDNAFAQGDDRKIETVKTSFEMQDVYQVPEKDNESYHDTEDEKPSPDKLASQDKEEKEFSLSNIKPELHSSHEDIEEMEVDIHNDDKLQITENENMNEKENYEKSEEEKEIAELGNSEEGWNSVNIFEASKFTSITHANLDLDADKTTEGTDLHDSNSESEIDVNTTTIDSSFHIKSEGKKDVEMEVLNGTSPKSKKDNTSFPWENEKNEEIFEEVGEFQEEQNSDLQNAEMLKRKKVRVEDVFTDSDGDESPRKIKKLESKESASEKIQNGGEVPSKKAKYKRERATSINLPAIMLAFEKGWIREVVYRSSSGIANKRADVYYYSPSNRKFRSRVELEEYLVKNSITDLSLQNFSFFKEPLGVEEKYEKIRHASNLIKLGDVSSLAVDGTDGAKPLPKKRIRKPSTKVKESPPSKKAKIKGVVKKVMIKEAVTKSSPTSVKKKTQGPQVKANYHVPTMDAPVYATHLHPITPSLTQVRILTPVIRGEAKDKTFHCTPACEAGGGSVPNLQCVKCVCLFHSECCQMPPQTIPLIHSAIAKFLCPNCYREESTNKAYLEAFKPCQPFEPLAFDLSSSSEDEGLVSDYEHSSYIHVNRRPSTPPLPPLLESSKQIPSFRPPPLNVPVLQSPSTMSPSVPQLIPNLPVAVPIPSSTASGATSYLIYQPVTKTANLQQQQPVVVTPSQVSFKESTQVASTVADSNQRTLTSPTVSPQLPENKVEKPIIPRVIPAVRTGLPFFEDMCTAYQLIRKIFTYLPLLDLLNVSVACTMWRDIVLAPCYWNSVHLRNVCVKDWKKMVEFLDKRGTSELDLRKMILFDGLVLSENKLGEESMVEIDEIDAGSSGINKDITPTVVNDTPIADISNETQLECVETVNNINNENNLTLDEEIKNLYTAKDSDIEMFSKVNIYKLGRHQEGNSARKTNDNEIGTTALERLKIEETKDQEETEGKDEQLDGEKKENEVEQMKEEDFERKMKEYEEMEEIRKTEVERKNKENEEIERRKKEEMEEHERKKRENEELERKKKEEKEKMEYLVSSVLSEHDYFERRRTPSGSSSNSSSSSSNSSSSGSDSDGSSSDSSDSEANLDVTEEDLETSLLSCEDKEIDEEPSEREALKSPESLHQESLIRTQSPENLEETTTPAEPTEDPVKSPVNIEKDEAQVKDANESLEQNTTELTKVESIIQPVEEKAPIKKEWEIISLALSTMKSLRKLVVGDCDYEVVETLLTRCHQLTSFSSYNFGSDLDNDDDDIKFDPSVLMQTRDLEELRLCSHKNFIFKSNFNFIKLPKLKMLTLKGLRTADIGWPYLGIHLTILRLSSISTFSHNNWLNISSMTELVELELGGNGSDHDSELCTALGKLTNLTKLSLFDWNIGSKLPHTLKRLHNIKNLHVIPAIETEILKGVFAGRLMVVVESSKHLHKFTWGIQPPNIVVDESGGEKIYILNMKAGKETGSVEGEEVRSVSIDSLKGFIKCRIPQTKISVAKVSTNFGTWSPDQF